MPPLKNILLMACRPWLWTLRPLALKDLDPDPVRQFAAWYRRARRCLSLEFPDGMCLSTVTPDGAPDGRMVLLKEFDERGFVFFTNTLSAKGRALQSCPQAALTFYWEPLQRQVRISGTIEPVSADEADAYFATRPRASRIGAWASLQSAVLESRKILDARVRLYREKYEGQAVPRPPHWSGYRVKPERMEFWQLRASRLHDRFVYTRAAGGKWGAVRLYP